MRRLPYTWVSQFSALAADPLPLTVNLSPNIQHKNFQHIPSVDGKSPVYPAGPVC